MNAGGGELGPDPGCPGCPGCPGNPGNPGDPGNPEGPVGGKNDMILSLLN